MTVTSKYISTWDSSKNRGPRGFPGSQGGISIPDANDILTNLLTVDGTGSGLDADLLDGHHYSANWDTAYSWGDHAGLYLLLTGGTLAGNLSFDNDATERFIKSSVNGGAIRIRGNGSSATDRGLQFGQVDNTGAWVQSWVVIPADTGNVEFLGTPLFDADADFASNINFNDDTTERFIKSSVAGGALRLRGNSLATTDRGMKLGVVDNGGTFYQHINIEEGVSAAIGNIGIIGGLHVGGTADPGDNNLWIDGIAQEPNFISGWQGTNWQIQADGDAEFNNVLIRGGLSVFELIINQLHYQNGGLIIGAGAGKVDAISDDTVGTEIMTFHDPEGNDIVPFTEGAIVMVQRVDINRTDVVKKIVRQVDDITGMVVTLGVTTGWTTGDDTGIFEVGDEVVAIGHISDTDLDSCLYMSAIDSGNPFLRVMDGVSTYGKFSLGDKTTIKLQLGNLASLASYDILPASPGYGLYSDNAYLSGRIVLPSAGMTNEGSSGTDIRIWAGDSYANRTTAPFRVDQDGSLTAVGIAEIGTSSVTVEGALSNVAIQGPDIWENAYNGVSYLRINRLGYNGGDTQYRGVIIYGGKNRDKIFTVLGDDTNYIHLGNPNNARELSIAMVGNIDKLWGDQYIYAYSGVSNTTILSDPTLATYTETGTSYVIKRTITLGSYIKPNRTLRIRIDLKANTNTSYAQIYRNGSPVGTERSTISVSYVTYYEDIASWNAGDTIELYMKSTAGNTASVTNFYVCGTMITTIQNEITGTYS